ncbi:dipeptidase [Cohnella hashimotonis]|uniref:Membrane dipeptidase n=1 Tax=Cohnella hashimotonis TaxID=2826895 RepID=A0ABT6TH30_9BACL|nr:membrane dipeptidase [Cohnella hashimotonis]MDI4646132.1 membrane dipeptidase [Cohnella hashimotonis]
MRIADLHCDALSKLDRDAKLEWSAPSGKGLDVTAESLANGNIGLQAFAIWVPTGTPKTPESVLRQAALFHDKILSAQGMRLVKNGADVEAVLGPDASERGALLALEGADALRGERWALRLLHRLGLRMLGLTWNEANWACDGIMEPRGAGLTKEGRSLVAECEALGILIDVSHLSEKGFWETAELARRPFLASHSNARALCPHPRNLTDDQIRALVAANGLIGITFVPFFLQSRRQAGIDDVLRHVEHICTLGGANHIAFGSDFDGIDTYTLGLAGPADYSALADALLARHAEPLVRGWLSGHARRFLTDNLK